MSTAGEENPYQLSSDDSDDNENDNNKEQEDIESVNEQSAILPSLSTARQNDYTVYWPTFRDPMIAKATTKEQMKNVHKQFLKKNWLTPGLCEEIVHAAPKASDVDKSNGQRDTDAFKKACSLIFPVGRQFASSIQIQQVARDFLDQWAVSSTSFGKQIRCYYSKPPTRYTRPNDYESSIRQSKAPKKCNCPFAIRFQPVGHRTHDSKPPSFLMVRVSSVNLNHTCTLSTIFHRSALQSAGRLSIDITKVQSLLILLRDSPRLPSATLRPLLERFLPHHKGINSKFINNFRRKARKFLLTHDEDHPITLEDAKILSSDKKISAADEIINIDDPLVTQNIKKMFRKIIQEDTKSWSALRLLEAKQRKIPGFVFSILKNKQGKPCALMYMTPRMRQNIIRFGDIFFLDAQQRQFNTSGFPYISPCMTNEEGKVAQGAEAIVLEESLVMYQWILSEMARLEPRFKLSNIQFIFGDGKITQRLLDSLGIQNTCTLHADTWHLMNEVWPKQTNFGNEFPKIKRFLKGMLESQTRVQWEDCFHNARSAIVLNHQMVEKLTKIFQNPSKYAGYYLTSEKEGSLGKRGDTHAEQNHASVVSYLGCGGNLVISEQIQKLLTRHVNRVRVKTEQESSLEVELNSPFQSKYEGAEGDADKEARLSLSAYAHKKFFRVTIEKAMRLQCCIEDEDTVTVWPCNIKKYEEATLKQQITFKKGNRCPCYRRRVYLIQCEHELVMDNQFHVEMFHHRWYNVPTYCSRIMNIRAYNFFLPQQQHIQNNSHRPLELNKEDELVECDDDNDQEENNSEDNDSDNSNNNKKKSNEGNKNSEDENNENLLDENDVFAINNDIPPKKMMMKQGLYKKTMLNGMKNKVSHLLFSKTIQVI